MFLKTDKTKSVTTQSSINQLESTQLVLKSAGKETQIFTYWNDSGYYQFQNIKEQMDQTKLKSLKTEEKQQDKQTISTKKMEAENTLMIVAILVLVVGCYFILSNKYQG